MASHHRQVLFIGGGASLAVIFGSHEPQDYTVDELLDLFVRPPFLAYAAALVVGIVLTYALVVVWRRSWRRNTRSGDSSHVVGSGDRGDEAGPPARPPRIDGETSDIVRAPAPKRLGFAIAALGAMVGSTTSLFAKATSELLQTSVGGASQFGSVFTFLFIAGVIITSVSQVSAALSCRVCRGCVDCYLLVVLPTLPRKP